MRSPGVVIAAGGDISLAGVVTEGLQRFGAGWVFKRLAPALRAADLFTANLESPLLPNGIEPAARRHAVPGELLDAFFNARLPPMAFTLANNHAFDAGRAGVLRTQRKLGKIGITHFGAGRDGTAAREPRFVDVKGLRIGFLGRTEDSPQVNDKGFPGPGLIRYPQLLRDVRGAAGRCDALIVHLHQGLEFVDWPGPHMVRLCRELVAAGARIVIGNHPHVPQGWEFVFRGPRPAVAGGSAPRGRLSSGEAHRTPRTPKGIIFYSLGNLVFDVARNPYVRQGSPWTNRSVVAMIPLSRSGIGEPTFIPYRIGRAGRPIP
ncbi:MAG TPA: CapA family protein, partial [Candidatus Acidoferrum sp.]|nr:CapA family protein [Candidatus Acidoferrum sp.]